MAVLKKAGVLKGLETREPWERKRKGLGKRGEEIKRKVPNRVRWRETEESLVPGGKRMD